MPAVRRPVSEPSDAVQWAVAVAARTDALRVYDPPPANTTRERRWNGQRLPQGPYAVYLHDRHGRLRTLALDFDGDKGDAVQEAAQVMHLFQSVGMTGVVVASGSLTGRHVLTRLTSGLDYATTAEFAHRLQLQHASLDISPLLNPKTGAIRPPGSPHRAGGIAQIVDPTDVRDAWRRWQQVGSVDQIRALLQRLPGGEPRGHVSLPNGLTVLQRPPSEFIMQLLTHGDPQGIYRSRSELEFAIILGLLNAGWPPDAITALAEDPRIQGFPKFRALRATQPRRAEQYWARTLANALARMEQHPPQKPPVPELAAIRHQVSGWHPGGRTAAVDRRVLDAHLRAAEAAGTLEHTLSLRQCAEWAGIRQLVTVLRARIRLRQRGWLTPQETSPDDPTHAQAFVLHSPSLTGEKIQHTPQPRGGRESMLYFSPPPTWFYRPWLESGYVGHGPMETWAALQSDGPASVSALARRVGHDRKTVRGHLARLHAYGLAMKAGNDWQAIDSKEGLPPAPEMAQSKAQEEIDRHQAERETWRVRQAKAQRIPHSRIQSSQGSSRLPKVLAVYRMTPRRSRIPRINVKTGKESFHTADWPPTQGGD